MEQDGDLPLFELSSSPVSMVLAPTFFLYFVSDFLLVIHVVIKLCLQSSLLDLLLYMLIFAFIMCLASYSFVLE